MGTLLFNACTHRSVHAFLGRLGVCVAYDTTITRLRSLGLSAAMNLKALGQRFAEKKVTLHFVYDNVNQYARVWRPSLGAESLLESGTAGYMIVLPDVDASVMNGLEYERRRRELDRDRITWQRLRSDLDYGHLENVMIGRILKILLDHVPYLSQCHSDFLRRFIETKCAKHPVTLRKTEYYALQCSSFDEATTSGNRDVVHDFLLRQLGIKEEDVDGRVIGFSGDQLTVSRLRTLSMQTSSGSSWFSRNRFLLPQIELWHMGAAFQKAIFNCHWSDDVSKGNIGLHYATDRLRRKINPKKLDYYPADRLLEVTVASLVLHYIRCMLFSLSK